MLCYSSCGGIGIVVEESERDKLAEIGLFDSGDIADARNDEVAEVQDQVFERLDLWTSESGDCVLFHKSMWLKTEYGGYVEMKHSDIPPPEALADIMEDLKRGAELLNLSNHPSLMVALDLY